MASRVMGKDVLVPLPLSCEPLIVGRVASPWLFEHMHDMSHDDFYNQDLTEADLKRKYSWQVQ